MRAHGWRYFSERWSIRLEGLTKVDSPETMTLSAQDGMGLLKPPRQRHGYHQGGRAWEFGVNEGLKGKADDDFDKSVLALEQGRTL